LGNQFEQRVTIPTPSFNEYEEVREKLVKIGVKVVRHGSYITFQLAEVAISRDVFADILSRSNFTKGRLLLHNLTFTRPTRAVKTCPGEGARASESS